MEDAALVTAVSLPEDLQIEILVRVKDARSLFRFATACKRWRHLVSDPSFLRRRWPDQDYSSFLVGFFPYYGEGYPQSCIVPTPRSPLGPGLRPLGSFITAANALLFDDAVPLASRHGLLLVRLGAHDVDGRRDWNILQLAVCSLLTGTCHILPPLKFATAIGDIDEYEYGAYAILTAADCRSNDESSPPVLPRDSSFFKVVVITADYHLDVRYSFHMFSSNEARWSAPTNCFGNTSQGYGLFSDAIVCRGMAHWLFRDCKDRCFYVISLNTRTNQISKKKLYLQKDYFLTSFTLAIKGTLSVLWMQKTGTQLEIWSQQEDQQGVGGTYSECTRTIEQKELGVETEGRKLNLFGEKCGTLLVNDGQHMYTADLETGAMEEVSNWPRKASMIRPGELVALEMDWPTIFISRLSRTF